MRMDAWNRPIPVVRWTKCELTEYLDYLKAAIEMVKEHLELDVKGYAICDRKRLVEEFEIAARMLPEECV